MPAWFAYLQLAIVLALAAMAEFNRRRWQRYSSGFFLGVRLLGSLGHSAIAAALLDRTCGKPGKLPMGGPLCECNSMGCAAVLPVSLEEFAELRSRYAGAAIVLLDHVAAGEHVLAQTDKYAVVAEERPVLL